MWPSDGAEGASSAACQPVVGPPGAGTLRNPAEPHAESLGAFGQLLRSLCAWSLGQDEGCARKEEKGYKMLSGEEAKLLRSEYLEQ